jgi:transcriptional regulator with XRE-family HTH domain
MSGSNAPPSAATDAELLAQVGARLAELRRGQRLTVVEVAQRTGLSRSTIAFAERGKNPTLSTLVRLLRTYGRLDAIAAFLPPPELSPMALIAPPKRARRG